MNARPMARGFLQVAAILLLVAFWSTVFWLIPEKRRVVVPIEPPRVAGLRSGMSLDQARELVGAWWTYHKIEPAQLIGRPDGTPIQAVAMTLERGLSPFGIVLQGSLLFLEDHLYWVDLELDGWTRDYREKELLGPPAGQQSSFRYWRLDDQKGWAYMTGGLKSRHLTLAFHEALLEAGLIDADGLEEVRSAFEAEIREALATDAAGDPAPGAAYAPAPGAAGDPGLR